MPIGGQHCVPIDKIAQNLGYAEQAHGQRHEVQTIGTGGDAKGKRGVPE